MVGGGHVFTSEWVVNKRRGCISCANLQSALISAWWCLGNVIREILASGVQKTFNEIRQLNWWTIAPKRRTNSHKQFPPSIYLSHLTWAYSGVWYFLAQPQMSTGLTFLVSCIFGVHVVLACRVIMSFLPHQPPVSSRCPAVTRQLHRTVCSAWGCLQTTTQKPVAHKRFTTYAEVISAFFSRDPSSALLRRLESSMAYLRLEK